MKKDGERGGGDLHFIISICTIYFSFKIFIIDYKNNYQFLSDFIHFVIGFLLFFGVSSDLREFRRLIRCREVERQICLQLPTISSAYWTTNCRIIIEFYPCINDTEFDV